MLRDCVIFRDRSTVEIEIVLDITGKCHVTYCWLVDGRKCLARVKDSFLTVVPKKESTALMGRRRPSVVTAMAEDGPGSLLLVRRSA